jgi:hypothetical protein
MMKHKIISATIYGITAGDLAVFFKHFYGASQFSPTYFGLVNVALIGVILFVLALVFSLFTPRLGTVCALVACVLSWPFFSVGLSPTLRSWQTVVSVMRYSYGAARLISLYMLIVSTVYSLSELRLFLQTKQRLG